MVKHIFALGPAGTNGHEATQKALKTVLYGKCNCIETITFCQTNLEILERARDEQAYGVVPIENTTAGLVDVVRDFWLRQSNGSVSVIGKIEIPIEHHLLAHAAVADVKNLTTVLSHPQALAQCSQNLRRLGLAPRATTSTAAAAQEIASKSELRASGALASRFAAEIYGLRVLQGNLEDSPGNATFFHVVGPVPTVPTGNDQTVVIFWTYNEPGALLNALWPISAAKSNMSSIHVIPLGSVQEYAFFCEFDGHQDDERGRKIFTMMRQVTKRILVLGSFPKGGGR